MFLHYKNIQNDIHPKNYLFYTMYIMNACHHNIVIVVFLKLVMILKGCIIKLLIYYAFKDMGGA